MVLCLSSELKDRLSKVTEEDCKKAQSELQADFPRAKSLLLKIAQAKKFDALIWMEGTKQNDLNQDEKHLSLLERANLIKGLTRYTHRNVYRQYELTQKGTELAEKLAAET
jgi:hypothetical protein